MNKTYSNWKNALKNDGEILFISEDRPFTHDEGSYGSEINFEEIHHGLGVMNIMKSLHCDFNSPGIEIGSGNGLVSVSLAKHHAFPDLIISDASSNFVKICKKNVSNHSPITKVSFAVFNGDDLSLLPDNSFSLICLANALHHIEDFRTFIQVVSKKLVKNGAFIIQEPIADGFLMLGLLVKSYVTFNKGLKESSKEKFIELALTMSNSNRRDISKSHLEDKHIFNLFEMQEISSSSNLTLTVFPNVSLSSLSGYSKGKGYQQEKFSEMCKGYIEYCLNWDAKIKKQLVMDMEECFKYIDTACSGGFPPPISGVLCMKKG